jgi:hypothetical protein
MNVSRFVKAGQLIATVSLSRIEELVRLAARVPREAAGEAAVQIGDASVNAGRLIVDVTGSSLRAVGRGVAEVGRSVAPDDED